MATASKMKSAFETDPNEPPPAEIKILSGRTLDEIHANQPVPVIGGGLAVRKITNALSSGGGTGKTTWLTQVAIETRLELPICGCEEFQPASGVEVLYVNAEDGLPAINYTLKRMLPAYGLTKVPFDEFPVSESGGHFPLNAVNAQRLIERIIAKPYGLVIFDPKVALLPTDFRFLDPGAVRAFLNGGFGAIQRETDAACWLADHDNKGGQALTGPADWSNFARLALHLERGDVDGQMTLTTVKTNLGYQFKRIVLERDPATGRSTVVELERYGDRAKAGSTADADTVLSKLFRTTIIPLPSERRTKEAVIAALFAAASPLGIKRTLVRDFANSRIEYDDRKLGRTWGRVAVRLCEPGEEPER